LRLFFVAAVAFALGCKSLPADPDGRPQGARPILLGVAQHDSMKCDEGDCADWYSFELNARTPVVIQLDPDTGPAWNVEVELLLYDAVGNVIATEKTEGRPSLTVKSDLAPGSYYVAVGSATGGNLVPYTLVARESKRPAASGPAAGKKPGSPRFETKRGSVLEISDNGRAVLLDIGKSQGIRVGLKGRLLSGGAAAGSLEIVEVYPEGSLARLSGGAKPQADSTAEIDVPVAATPAR
jgi:hypothetical protein